jgi:hypothetical protein
MSRNMRDLVLGFSMFNVQQSIYYKREGPRMELFERLKEVHKGFKIINKNINERPNI